MRKISWFVLVVFFAFFESCAKDNTSSNLYIPSSSDVTTKATLAELQEGRTLYMNTCISCHNLYSPDDYSISNWKNIVPNMAAKTNLTSTQVTLITKYLCKGKQ